MSDLELAIIIALEFLVAAALGWYGLRVRRIAAEQMEQEL